ncbi:MAG: YceI family protein [Mariprofundaceae bacterium]|nr:YceI family protein [Mariprofundaceae bacterium]
MKLKYIIGILIVTLGFTATAQAAENYAFDIKGQHAFIQFKVKHLGYSWLLGSFKKFNGSFTYDQANPSNNSVRAEIDVRSLDTNHAERDKHLRSADFFDVATFPKATFVSTSYKDLGDGKGIMTGKFTLRGISKIIQLDVTQIGTGNDPWGGYRRGFEARTTLHLSDYKMLKSSMLGAAAENVELYFSIEGVRQ